MDTPQLISQLAEAAQCAQLDRTEAALRSLLPAHLQDGSDLEVARIWFLEHNVHLEVYDHNVTLVYPSYLEPSSPQ